MAVLSRRPLVHLAKANANVKAKQNAKRGWAHRNGGGKRGFSQLGGGSDPPASSFPRGGDKRTLMSDFHYYNVFLLGGSDLVKLTSAYTFCENKNMYACILLHLSSVYGSIPVRDVLKVLKNIFEQNKASFSHHLVKGRRVTDLYKHMCHHLDQLNTAEVIALLKCACYTTQEFPVECIRLLSRVILAKPLGCFHPKQIHEVCSCLIKMKNEFSLRKLTYDDALHVKMREHVRGRIAASDAQAFFEYLPLYIGLSRETPLGGAPPKGSIPPSGSTTPPSGGPPLERNLRKTCELIFLNHLNELNRESLLSAVGIFRWLDLRSHSIFLHLCDAFLQHALSLDTKYVVRFWRKCHSLRFAKGGRRGEPDGGKPPILDETVGSTKGGVPPLGEEEPPVDHLETLKRGEGPSEGGPPLRGTTPQGGKEKNGKGEANEEGEDKNEGGENEEGSNEEGSNVLLRLINSRVYHMTPPQLSRVTYGLYSFVENMRQYSQLSSLRNNMNLLFSMAVQYVVNCLHRGVPPGDAIPRGSANLLRPTEGDHPSNINMSTDVLYISASGVYVSRGDRYGEHPSSGSLAGDDFLPNGCPTRRANLTHSCDILLNISFLNVSQNHRKNKDVYECVKKIITQKEDPPVELDHLLSLLLCISNVYNRTRDNYVFHFYKQILPLLQMNKLKFDARHFNRLSIAITPLLQEKNSLIGSYVHLLCFFIETEVVPLRSCVFTLQHVMKKICVKLGDSLATLLLVVIRRIDSFLRDVRAHVVCGESCDSGAGGDSGDGRNSLRPFLLLHSINESTLTCVLVSLSLILQSAKYGTAARDEAAVLLRAVVPYVSTASLEKIPRKYIHEGLLEALPPDDTRVRQVLLSRA
ncbi:conserved Plasmodium protein, unknown function [Plasmodium vivax]|uniref:Uncharacterized protein n=1 Tax=Plasmodium vivax TaxID=5855 RepID=A0A564ZNV6_PLAVI|nr:conserved Plasmodium protein, unknown function [Plasmodium vivax]